MIQTRVIHPGLFGVQTKRNAVTLISDMSGMAKKQFHLSQTQLEYKVLEKKGHT